MGSQVSIVPAVQASSSHSPSPGMGNTQGPCSWVHLDFARPFLGQTFLIVVDAYSKWVELDLMLSTRAEATIRVWGRLFATHRLPDIVLLDNSLQFTSAPFQMFLAKHGICHAPMAPFHPAMNSLDE